jgi:outer membrane protein OmpA-like peptidoglycan-associated protein
MPLTHQKLRIAALISISTLSLLLSACGGGDTAAAPHSFAFVVGDRSNSNVPAPEALIGEVPDDLMPGARVAAFEVDGSADGVTVFSQVVPKAETDFDQKEVPGQIKAELRSALEAKKPDQPEANTLGAISSAVRALHDTSGDKTIKVADSLLSTAGVLQFQVGLLDSTPEDVVASVSKDELPDLSGIDVEIYGAGEVRDPQAALTESKRKRLEEIWNRLMKLAGAKSVTFHSALPERKDIGALPPVTVVAISNAIAAAPPVGCTQILSEQLVQFVPDTADFADPNAARQTIAAVAESMKGCQGKISVTGTTSSWGDAAGRQRTSQDRAETVRNELAAAMGVDASTIVAVGVGMDFPGYANDRDAGGRLIPADAAKNRTVRITEG